MQIQLDIERIRKNKLFIATPMYGGQAAGLYIKSILDLQGMLFQNGIENRYSFLFNESLITRARNYLADEFLRSDATHLLFIDSDIEFQAMDVLAMMHFDKDIIGGPYPKKTIKWGNIDSAYKKAQIEGKTLNPDVLEALGGDYVFNPVPGTKQFRTDDLIEVMEIGTGFMMIKREVFEQFIEEYPHLRYKPDHAGAANFDGTRYIHAFFDTVIDPDTHRYLSEDYFFCIDSQSEIVTEDGMKTIRDIVTNKYSGKVLSINPNNNEKEWKSVTGWSVRSNKDVGKKWVKLIPDNNNNRFSNLICTSDHKVAYLNDVMMAGDGDINYIESSSMAGKYSIRTIQKNENALYSGEQMEFLIGSLLGDSHINKNGQMSFSHSEKQREYLELKQKIFNGGTIYTNKSSNNSFKKDSLQSSFVLPVNAQTRKLRTLFYDENGKRTIKNIIDYITEKSLAFWYMDDGSINGQSVVLHTESLSHEDNVLLSTFFDEKFGWKPVIDEIHRKYKDEERIYYHLRFNNEDSLRFLNIIVRYIPEFMKWKLPSEYKTIVNYQYDYDNLRALNFSARYIKDVKYLENHRGKLYDITVNDNHNFFANGSLVHNCQMARAMGRSVWYCPWMQTTHVGTYGFKGNLPVIANLVGTL